MCSSLRFSDNKATESFSIFPAYLIPSLSAPVCVDSEQVVLIINPGEFSVLFGIREWAAAAACLERAAPCSVPMASRQRVGRATLSTRTPLSPREPLFVPHCHSCSSLASYCCGCSKQSWALAPVTRTACVSSSWFIFAFFTPAKRMPRSC